MLLASACTASGQQARTAAAGLYFSSSQPPMRMLTTRRPYFHPRCTSAAAALEELLLLELAGLSSRLGRGATILVLASIESSDSGRTHPPSLFLAVFAADTTSELSELFTKALVFNLSRVERLYGLLVQIYIFLVLCMDPARGNGYPE